MSVVEGARLLSSLMFEETRDVGQKNLVPSSIDLAGLNEAAPLVLMRRLWSTKSSLGLCKSGHTPLL